MNDTMVYYTDVAPKVKVMDLKAVQFHITI